MPYIKDYQIKFLASAKFTAFTYQISNSGVTPNAQGRKIVPAGTVYPANDATAIGDGHGCHGRPATWLRYRGGLDLGGPSAVRSIWQRQDSNEGR